MFFVKRFGRSYRILHVLEFNSDRKRMSVIVKDEEGKTFLFSKGADRYVLLLNSVLVQ
jgi:magnesium-transporting ATPase (P-type)